MALRLRILCKWNLVLPGSGISTGFSEGFYCEKDTLEAGTNLGYNLSIRRKALLPEGATLFSLDAKDVTNPGRSQSVPGELTSSATFDTDVPWNCLLLGGRNASGNRHNIYVHAVPDEFVVKGGFKPNGTYNTRLNEYMTYLKGNGIQFRGRVLNSALKTVGPAIPTNDGGAIITYAGAAPFAVGDIVTGFRVRDVFNRPVKGKMLVTTITPLEYTFKVYPWKVDRVLTLFKMRKVEFDYYGNEIVNPNRIIIKKTGAPFGHLVGRASKKT